MRIVADFIPFLISDDHGNDKLEEQIESFAKLKQGWNFGEGESFSQQVIDNAIFIYKIGKMHGLLAEAFPGIDGDIVISFQNKEHFLDIKINPNASFVAEYEKGIGENFTSTLLGLLNISDIKEKIRWLSNLEIQDLSEYSVYSTLALVRSGLEMKSLKYLNQQKDFLYSTTNAERECLDIQYAHT